jgi:polyhydroxyalkanoate synthesis regulator phasin
VIDALKGYVQLATGLTEVTARKAYESATALLSQLPDFGRTGPEAVKSSVQDIADDLVEQSRTNREMVVGLVRTEVDRAVGRMGFVREEELAAVRRHVARLEAALAEVRDKARPAAAKPDGDSSGGPGAFA